MTLGAGETWRVDVADCRAWLRSLPAGYAHCCVTSPPYFGLRDYGVAGQIGLEKSPAEYVAELVAVFGEVRRVLRDDGTLWLNLGDSYSSHGAGADGKELAYQGDTIVNRKAARHGKPKDLIGIPWRVALALQADGWYLRSDIIWHKKSPMPESVRDRPTKSHEYLFLLSKRPTYYYDATAIREKSIAAGDFRRFNTAKKAGRLLNGIGSGNEHPDAPPVQVQSHRNKRTVWTLSNGAFKEAHFAVMPAGLVTPCVLAGTSEEGVCPTCGAPWRRVVKKQATGKVRQRSTGGLGTEIRRETHGLAPVGGTFQEGVVYETTGWQPGCGCLDVGPVPPGYIPVPTVPPIVIDPFTGAGTTGLVSVKYGRRFYGCELNAEYAAMARKRIERVTRGELFRAVPVEPPPPAETADLFGGNP